jgi:hypothetical protein
MVATTPEAKTIVQPSPRKELATKLTELQVAKVVDEPLLTPNPNRFVLFPIQFHDVSLGFVEALTLLICVGLEHVQEGRGEFLDSRRG